MTDEIFTASNGVVLDHLGSIKYAVGGLCGGCHPHEARKEFYQHLRDKELGRWRDPENPDYMVYPADADLGECWVVDEKDPTEYEPWTRVEVASGVYPTFFGYDTAKRYFDAHPETKPWHEARPREVWLVTVEGEEPEPMLVRGRKIYGGAHRFVADAFYDLLVTDPRITHAERIYPKAGEEGTAPLPVEGEKQ